jgi:hypothetical protein
MGEAEKVIRSSGLASMVTRAAKHLTLFACVLFGGCAHADLPVDFVSRIALSPNGEFAAIVTSHSADEERVALFRVVDRKLLLAFERNDLASFLDRPSIEDMAWSPDSSFLKVGITDGDLEHRVVVVQPRRNGLLQLVKTEQGHAVAAKWGATGSSLFAIVAGDEPEDYPGGLVTIDVNSGVAKSVIADRPVTAILDVSAKRVLIKAPYEHTRKLSAAIIEILLPSLERRPFISAADETHQEK